jgi:indolepyruvate ferredoxin oxidoreductase
VARTGGQPAEGGFTAPQIAQQVAAEGAVEIALVADEPEKYCGQDASLPKCVTVYGRDELDRVQRRLREIPGLTVLIYDQTCAAEKRRRRKRNLLVDPPKRAFINEAVCEGCSDCSVKSNCISVKPLETPVGRKRTIDQSSCNKDFSCVDGFCPSFVTVHGGRVRKSAPRGVDLGRADELPLPAVKTFDRPYNILITGIGGTSVITLGALLGMAAHLDGLGCSVLDFTGLAQKNGGVMSHVRIAPKAATIMAPRIGAGAVDLLLGCDIVVAASPEALSRLANGTTQAVINASLTPAAAFVVNGNIAFEGVAMQRVLRAAVGQGQLSLIEATRLATGPDG